MIRRPRRLRRAQAQLHPHLVSDRPRAVLSHAEGSPRAPPGLRAAEFAGSACGFASAFGFPSDALQTRAVLSSEAVTTRAPSGLNAAEVTESACPFSSAIGFPSD